jgi:hypothetical protein
MQKSSLPLILCATTASFLLSGCIDMPTGSGGGASRAYTEAISKEYEEHPSGFTITYDNWIEFNRSLIVSVDSVFARIRANDQDAINLVNDFASPGITIVRERTGIMIKNFKITPVFDQRKFVMVSDYTEWHEELPESINFANIKQLANCSCHAENYRWRLKLPQAEASFNSNIPKRVFIKGELLMEVQAFDRVSGIWINVVFNNEKINMFADALRRALNRAYYRYLLDKFDFSVTPDFRGTNEQ